MIFSQYKETCEVLLDYPTIGGGDKKDYVKKASRNILQWTSILESRILIMEFLKSYIPSPSIFGSSRSDSQVSLYWENIISSDSIKVRK